MHTAQVALSLNNLAALLRKMDKGEQAEKLYMRSLSIREEALGPDHPQVYPYLLPAKPMAVLFNASYRGLEDIVGQGCPSDCILCRFG